MFEIPISLYRKFRLNIQRKKEMSNGLETNEIDFKVRAQVDHILITFLRKSFIPDNRIK